MQTKLQELTEKIYQEGIEKANLEADKILDDAKKGAEETIVRAKKDAEGILKKAEKDAEALRKNSLNELQLAGRQAITDLKQKIVDLIETGTIKPETKETFKDDEFTRQIIETIIKNWNPRESETVDLTLLLPASKQKEFEKFFAGKTSQLMSKGLELRYADKMKSGFKIGPKEEGYLISFSEEDFESFFKAFLRPRLVELLFEAK